MFSTFLIELHLHDVLKDLLVIGVKFYFFYKIEIDILLEDSLENYDDFSHWISISMFPVKLNLDDVVLDVLLVEFLLDKIWFEFLLGKICRNSQKKLGWLIFKLQRYLTFQQLKRQSISTIPVISSVMKILCSLCIFFVRTLPRRCSQWLGWWHYKWRRYFFFFNFGRRKINKMSVYYWLFFWCMMA